MADMPRSDRRKDDLVDTISLHDGPTTIPLSMPAILRQNVPGYKARAARSARNTEQAIMSARERRAAGLIPAGEAGSSRNLSGSHSDERRFGKRRQRRWENANFHGSKHVTQPRSSDFSPMELSSQNTFPSPPPSVFFPVKHPSQVDAFSTAQSKVFDDSKASDFGRFSLPMKGLKRSIRRIVSSGGAGAEIVDVVDRHIRDWLDEADVYLNPDVGEGPSKREELCILSLNNVPSIDSGNESQQDVAIYRVSKQPHSLVWRIEDSFVRFLVHAVARYYRVVSFTKHEPATGAPLVYLLRPNMQGVRKVDPTVRNTLVTPPTTEWEASSIASLGNTSDSGLSQSLYSEEYSVTGTDTDGEAASEGGFVPDEVEEWSIVDGDETLTAEDHIQALHMMPTPSVTNTHSCPSPNRSQARQAARRRHRPTNLSDRDSIAESESGESQVSEDAGDGHIPVRQTPEDDSLRLPMTQLHISDRQGGVQRYSGRPIRTSSRAHAMESRDQSVERSTSPIRYNSSPGLPHSTSRQARETYQMARNSRDRTKQGWHIPEQGFLDWVTSH